MLLPPEQAQALMLSSASIVLLHLNATVTHSEPIEYNKTAVAQLAPVLEHEQPGKLNGEGPDDVENAAGLEDALQSKPCISE